MKAPKNEPTEQVKSLARGRSAVAATAAPAPEVLERAIVQISVAVTKLRASRLKDSTIVLLISHASSVSQRNVRAVLDAMQSLEATYLKKS